MLPQYAVPAQLVLGQVDAAQGGIRADAPQNLDELQATAERIRVGLMARVFVIEEGEHQAADRVGGAPAVLHERAEIGISGRGKVIAAGRKQGMERRKRQMALRDDACQFTEQGGLRLGAGGDARYLQFIFAQRGKPLLGRTAIHARNGADAAHAAANDPCGRAQLTRQEQEGRRIVAKIVDAKQGKRGMP